MPLGATTPKTWLNKLTLSQLRRVAFAIGAPSSGTKPVLTKQIQHELNIASTIVNPRSSSTVEASDGNNLSIVSIDMGIRNLAYAHLVAHPTAASNAHGNSAQPPEFLLRPCLMAWKRVVISGAPNGNGAFKKKCKEDRKSSDVTPLPPPATANETTTTNIDLSLPPATDKEAFDPSTFANYAYKFIKSILTAHRPTHVLIERQRFRSGGASAVQEWTIRVGVFEGMLHAVLRTLSAEHGLDLTVQGVDPGRVTRYWLESRRQEELGAQGSEHVGRASAKESKKAKIDIVGASLARERRTLEGGGGGGGGGALVEIGSGPENNNQAADRHHNLRQVVDSFISRWTKKKPNDDSSRKDPHTGPSAINKLDDLSDCLLQGIAWLEWQDKRHEILLRGGQEAFAQDPLFAPPAREQKSRRTTGRAKTNGRSLTAEARKREPRRRKELSSLLTEKTRRPRRSATTERSSDAAP